MVDQIIHSDPRTVAQAISLFENDAKVSFDFGNSGCVADLTEQIEKVFSRYLTPYDAAQELILHFKKS